MVSACPSGMVSISFCPSSVSSMRDKILDIWFPSLSVTFSDSVSNCSGSFISSTRVRVSSPFTRSSPRLFTCNVKGSLLLFTLPIFLLMVFFVTVTVAEELLITLSESFFTVIALTNSFSFPFSSISGSLTLVSTWISRER